MAPFKARNVTVDEDSDVLLTQTKWVVPDVRRYFQSQKPANTQKRRRDPDVYEIRPETPVKKNRQSKSADDDVEIVDLEDDHDPQATIRAASRRYSEIETTAENLRHDSVVDLTLDDYVTDTQLRNYIKRLSLQEEKDKAASLAVRAEISTYVNEKPRFKCAPSKCVELSDGSFLRIKSVLQDGHGKVFVTGHKLIRQNYQGLTMSKRRNEVVWTRILSESASAPTIDLHEVPVEDVLRNRQVTFTNQTFPLVSSRDDDASFSDPTQQVTLGPLFCRWLHTTVTDDSDRRKSVEHVLQRLTPRDADNVSRKATDGISQNARITAEHTRFQWRGVVTHRGGSHRGIQRTFNVAGKTEVGEFRAYTFADAFCGAGGVSRGAVDAGLNLKWAFDNNAEAIQSYAANFSRFGTDCRHESVDEFISHVMDLPDIEEVRVDVLHISPPCQPFSPAHTVPSPERDEINQAALPSVWQLVEKLKPRVVTIEETEGLVSRHKEWFGLLINTFTSLGYSVRWKVVQCHAYGVPQTRKRLLIIAAGPGEKLPPFPDPTHGDSDVPGRKPLATINDAINDIPASAPDHDQSVRFDGGPRAAFDGATQAKTITTNAGQGNYHPSGRRPYTLRELAKLQTFPLYHSFAGARGVTETKRQIGNAVPPVLAKAMFRSIVKSLKESDRERR